MSDIEAHIPTTSEVLDVVRRKPDPVNEKIVKLMAAEAINDSEEKK